MQVLVIARSGNRYQLTLDGHVCIIFLAFAGGWNEKVKTVK